MVNNIIDNYTSHNLEMLKLFVKLNTKSKFIN